MMDTSEDAYASMAESGAVVADMVLAAFHRAPEGLTADEVAARVGISRFTVRPTVCILHGKGRLRDTGNRRPNKSGRNAAVWRIA